MAEELDGEGLGDQVQFVVIQCGDHFRLRFYHRDFAKQCGPDRLNVAIAQPRRGPVVKSPAFVQFLAFHIRGLTP